MSQTRPSKRRAKPRALVRGEPVVRGVLEATLEELARAGYGALRIDDVAARAGVNKTTVYRRWPTKEELVRAALLSITSEWMTAPSTGALRTDLLEIGRQMIALGRSCEAQGLFRLFLAEGPDSELMTIARSMRQAHQAVPRSVIEAAEARGELAPGIDATMLFSAMVAPIKERLFMDREDVDEGFLVRLVDLLLYGAAPKGERPRAAADMPVEAPPAGKVPRPRRAAVARR
jgi:AcrR family transcriptional regulator